MLRRKLVRDLLRQRAQVLAIVLTLLLGAGLFGASFDAYRNLRASYARVFETVRAADLYVRGRDIALFAIRARGVKGVETVEARTVADLPIQAGGDKLLGRIVGVPRDGHPNLNRLLVDAGRALSGSSPGAVVLERHLARDSRLRPGDRIRVLGRSGWRSLRIRGVVSSAEYLWPARSRQDVIPAPGSFGVVFAGEPLAGELAGTDGPNEALVRYERGPGRDSLDRRLEQLAVRLGATAVTARAEQPSNAALQTDIDGFRDLAVLFPILFMGAATLATGVLLSRRVRAERQLIGTLRASGASRPRILFHYAGYGLAVGLGGGVTGAVAGALGAAAITRAYTSELDIPLAITSARASTAALAAGLTVLAGVAAAAAPALAAARVAPAEAMRGQAPGGPGGRSLAERLLPPLRRLPVRYRHVLRSVGRNRRRSLSTVLGVVLAAILILVGWGMLDTTQNLLARQYDDVDRQDASLRLDGPVTPSRLARIRRVPGVGEVEPAVRLPVALAGPDGRYATSLVAFRPGTSMHGFPHPALLDQGIVVGAALRERLGLSVGDSVDVVPAEGPRLRAAVAGFVDEPLGTFAYTSFDLLERAPTRVEPNEVLVRFMDGAGRAATTERLERLPIVASVTDTKALRRAFEEYLGLFYVFVGIMLAFAAALAFAIMFTTTSANLAERVGEVATLEASGVGYRVLARLLRAENLLLTAIGIAVGLPIAYVVAGRFMAAYSSDLFSFNLTLKWRTPVLTGGALVLVSVLSELPGLRSLRRIDIARAVRERGD